MRVDKKGAKTQKACNGIHVQTLEYRLNTDAYILSRFFQALSVFKSMKQEL